MGRWKSTLDHRGRMIKGLIWQMADGREAPRKNLPENTKKELIMQPFGKSSVAGIGVFTSSSLNSGKLHTANAQSASGQVVESKAKPTSAATKFESKKDASNEPGIKPLAAFQVRVGAGATPVQANMRGSEEARVLALQVAESSLEAILGAADCQFSAEARAELQEWLDRAEYRVAYETLVDLWNAGCRWPESVLNRAIDMGKLWGVEFPQTTCPIR